jgi:hypothetical protein
MTAIPAHASSIVDDTSRALNEPLRRVRDVVRSLHQRPRIGAQFPSLNMESRGVKFHRLSVDGRGARISLDRRG